MGLTARKCGVKLKIDSVGKRRRVDEDRGCESSNLERQIGGLRNDFFVDLEKSTKKTFWVSPPPSGLSHTPKGGTEANTSSRFMGAHRGLGDHGSNINGVGGNGL